MTAQQAMLDERYGRNQHPKARRVWWIVVGVVATAIVGVLGWMTVVGQQYSVSADDLGFQVIDEHVVDVTFQVATQPGVPVTCVLEALDEEFGVVGFRVLSYEASEQHQQVFSEQIRTVSVATTGFVKGCWKS